MEVAIVGDVITVTWTYDNSANDVPAMSFVATVFQDGIQQGDPISVPITLSSITVPTSILTANQPYMVSVVVRSLQGDSDAISETFTYNSAIGKLFTI